MKSTLASICLAALLALPMQASRAGIVIGLTPSAQTVQSGSSIDVALTISGLSTASIAAFDITVAFDPARLGFVTAIFGDPLLGDQLNLLGLGSIQGISGGAGSVELFEVSLDAIADLENLQGDQFTLAMLRFDGLSAGVSPLTLAVNGLADASGAPLAAEASNATLTVPEPSSMALVAVALLGSLRVARHGRRGGQQYPFR